MLYGITVLLLVVVLCIGNGYVVIDEQYLAVVLVVAGYALHHLLSHVLL